MSHIHNTEYNGMERGERATRASPKSCVSFVDVDNLSNHVNLVFLSIFLPKLIFFIINCCSKHNNNLKVALAAANLKNSCYLNSSSIFPNSIRNFFWSFNDTIFT